jgi:hypothetical protein
MRRLNPSRKWDGPSRLALVVIAAGALVTGIASRADLPDNAVTQEQVMRGRLLVLHHMCGDCHNRGKTDVNDPKWLAGITSDSQAFAVGEFITRPRNLTPHNTTGLGRFTPRQIFNALRFGLRPGETPDVVITSTVPGEGNFPEDPHYLAPPMPWPSWRHMSDQELWDIIAYLKHGIKPVNQRVRDSEGPQNFWASEYTTAGIGTYPLPPFPAASEQFRP